MALSVSWRSELQLPMRMMSGSFAIMAKVSTSPLAAVLTPAMAELSFS